MRRSDAEQFILMTNNKFDGRRSLKRLPKTYLCTIVANIHEIAGTACALSGTILVADISYECGRLQRSGGSEERNPPTVRSGQVAVGRSIGSTEPFGFLGFSVRDDRSR